ncbi:hypothetical protein ANTRET_LOCUS715 [Anthophora retusa]
MFYFQILYCKRGSCFSNVNSFTLWTTSKKEKKITSYLFQTRKRLLITDQDCSYIAEEIDKRYVIVSLSK